MKKLAVMLTIAAIGLPMSGIHHAHAQMQGQTGKPGGAAAGMAGKGMAQQGMTGRRMISPGLVLPSMDPARGRHLFAIKGCVVCHSVNGVGGKDAPPLDAATMTLPMNPFEFAAKMWRGAEAMVAMQREELGQPIKLTGQELADIIAFAHDAQEQKKLSTADIPPNIRSKMEGMEGEKHEKEGLEQHKGGMMHGHGKPKQ